MTILLSLACACIFIGNGISVFAPLFWFKITTLALIYYYIREYKSREFYFYKNLGIGRRALWIFSISLDLAIYFVVIVIGLYLHGKFS
jgi:hypothetical protein